MVKLFGVTDTGFGTASQIPVQDRRALSHGKENQPRTNVRKPNDSEPDSTIMEVYSHAWYPREFPLFFVESS
jgi:hypothetical protein